MSNSRYQLVRKVGLLKYKDVYAAGKYASYVSLCYKTRAACEKPEKETVLFLYTFKKYFKHSLEWEEIVRVIADHFQCDDIVAVPAHIPDANSLQKIFGIKIGRIKEVEPRKYTRSTGWPIDYEGSYVIHEDNIAGHRILLVDDVFITGRTISLKWSLLFWESIINCRPNPIVNCIFMKDRHR